MNKDLLKIRLLYNFDCIYRPFSTGWNFPHFLLSERHFPLGGMFRAECYFLSSEDQLAESGRQKTKQNAIPRGKFRLVENGLKDQLAGSGRQKIKEKIIPGGKFRQVESGPITRFSFLSKYNQ